MDRRAYWEAGRKDAGWGWLRSQGHVVGCCPRRNLEVDGHRLGRTYGGWWRLQDGYVSGNESSGGQERELVSSGLTFWKY